MCGLFTNSAVLPQPVQHSQIGALFLLVPCFALPMFSQHHACSSSTTCWHRCFSRQIVLASLHIVLFCIHLPRQVDAVHQFLCQTKSSQRCREPAANWMCRNGGTWLHLCAFGCSKASSRQWIGSSKLKKTTGFSRRKTGSLSGVQKSSKLHCNLATIPLYAPPDFPPLFLNFLLHFFQREPDAIDPVLLVPLIIPFCEDS